MTLTQNSGGAAAAPDNETMGIGSSPAAPSDGGGDLPPIPSPPVSNCLTAASFNAGSQQLRCLRRAFRDGLSIEAAAELADIPVGEARLHHADFIENPPPPAAFEPIGSSTKDDDMARTARTPKDDDTGEIKTKDFALAVKLVKHDIMPARSKAAEHMQEASTAFKAVKKQAHIQPSAVKAAIVNVVEAEDAKADDWLRCFVGYINESMGRTVLTFHSNDLVDMAEGKAPPAGARPKPKLVTLPTPPADDSDLADAGGGSDGEEFEMTADELAAQEGRGTADEA